MNPLRIVIPGGRVHIGESWRATSKPTDMQSRRSLAAQPLSRGARPLGRAVVLRTETESILKSRRVVPTRLLEAGFQFQFPAWKDAARDLVARWRLRRRA